MFALPPSIVVFDTEYTSWPGNNERGWNAALGEYKEIVQIGAVRVDSTTWAEQDALSMFVRPEKNPILSDYFTVLTGISQERIDAEGVSFSAALLRLGQFSEGCHLYSFGNDEDELEENAALAGIPFSFDRERFHDVRDIFEREGVPAKTYTSGTIMRAFNKEPSRTPHHALNDARSILDGLRELGRACA